MARASLVLLKNELKIRTGRTTFNQPCSLIPDGTLDLTCLVSHNNEESLRRQLKGRADYVADKRTAGNLVKHFCAA
jgi:hypothetical protein